MTKVKYTPAAPSLEDRLREATDRVEAHVAYMKKRETEFASPQEIAQLQRTHAENLRIWSGLKEEAERCRK